MDRYSKKIEGGNLEKGGRGKARREKKNRSSKLLKGTYPIRETLKIDLLQKQIHVEKREEMARGNRRGGQNKGHRDTNIGRPLISPLSTQNTDPLRKGWPKEGEKREGGT